MWTRRHWIAAAGSAISVSMRADSAYIATIEAWRREKEESLKADDGWLAVAGLHWLNEGPNTIDDAPGHVFTLHANQVTLSVNRQTSVLRPDIPGPADHVTIGGKTIFVIARGGRFGLRIRDKQSPYRAAFRGLRWFSVRPEYRLTARWIPHATPIPRNIATVTGIDEIMTSPGVAQFDLENKKCTVEPVLSEEKLFFIFKDLTAGKTTYPAGRFLYAPSPRNGLVELDFNQAYNPPCAFTPYATCPLPPRHNHLPVSVEAGELNYHHD